jgi:hypothetical protein
VNNITYRMNNRTSGTTFSIYQNYVHMAVKHKKDKYRPILIRDNGLSFRYCDLCTNLRPNGKSRECKHGGTGTLSIIILGMI